MKKSPIAQSSLRELAAWQSFKVQIGFELTVELLAHAIFFIKGDNKRATPEGQESYLKKSIIIQGGPHPVVLQYKPPSDSDIFPEARI